ncbi:MAG: divalent-cation tolerance protein CutA [Zoogloeaceae bacterium]|nr:divalent-cation tolerance protein CutA [Zoogloeaceae bacterium]
MSEILVVFTNVPDEAMAGTLARRLVDSGLAACVNVLAPYRSVYRWQGAVEEAAEVPLLIKTTRARYADLERTILDAHPFEVPEIIALPVTHGLPDYLDWVETETRAPNPPAR